MATKQIKDYSAVSAPAAADLLITQQAADNVTKKITITQIIATVKAIASGLASLNSSVKVVEQPASITDHLDNTAGGTDSEVTKAPTSNVMYDHGVKTTAVHGVGGSNVCSESTADSKIATHAGLADPHTGYRLESADHTHLSTGAQGGVLNLFGAWEGKALTTVYLAATDGWVSAWASFSSVNQGLYGYTDGSNPPTTIRDKSYTEGDNSAHGIKMPVRKGDRWKVVTINSAPVSSEVYWLPIGG